MTDVDISVFSEGNKVFSLATPQHQGIKREHMGEMTQLRGNVRERERCMHAAIVRNKHCPSITLLDNCSYSAILLTMPISKLERHQY